MLTDDQRQLFDTFGLLALRGPLMRAEAASMERESEEIMVNGNGHHADGNSHDDLSGIGPTVELVPVNRHKTSGNGHAAVTVNGNGYHDEAESVGCERSGRVS